MIFRTPPKPSQLICGLPMLLLALGCQEPPQPAPARAPTAAQRPASASDSGGSMQPRYRAVQVFVNNRRYGDSNGCTSTFMPRPDQAARRTYRGGLQCGHAGAVSHVTWEYLKSDEAGDHYRFERLYPYQTAEQQAESKEVVYQGRELLIFEDDVQRILMKPTNGEIDR